jgi:excisionase family DNA binding protein
VTDQQLLTVEQIASEFQLTSQTIRNWIKSGALSAVRIGHVYRVRREDVDAMMRRHQGETAPLGTHRDLWAPETLGLPYRRREDRRQPSIWDGTSSSITPAYPNLTPLLARALADEGPFAMGVGVRDDSHGEGLSQSGLVARRPDDGAESRPAAALICMHVDQSEALVQTLASRFVLNALVYTSSRSAFE